MECGDNDYENDKNEDTCDISDDIINNNSTSSTTNNNNNNNNIDTMLTEGENEIINIAHCSKTVISKKKQNTHQNTNNTNFERVSIFTPPTAGTVINKPNSFYMNSYTSSQNSF
ncbi:unnamed protein product [Brachionus calyciflorus]|uniref:Uncharacterized protein n=1 Tax=Brachionus calyciflorus TaxID=104777 RepID=A0A814T6F0_9BILA|nr:unnamed protein product [Brachionus calyciflorus]